MLAYSAEIMGRFWAQFRQWENPAKIGFGLALLLLILGFALLAWGPESLRQAALIGVFGLVVVSQAIIMWANRGMVTPYTRAQRLYLAEDFAGACALLEQRRSDGKADARSLTLLGNAYRQRGMLDESELILREALALQADFHFPLYGFGRTLLIKGFYPEAAQAIEAALERGAPPLVKLDAAEAYYRQGRYDEAIRLLEAGLPLAAEPYRQLMGRYLLHRMQRGDAPDAALLAAGLPYWQAQADRFAFTAYGQVLFEDIRAMQALYEEAS
jgi:tetratricopeptide (TPR) repeat protein